MKLYLVFKNNVGIWNFREFDGYLIPYSFVVLADLTSITNNVNYLNIKKAV